MTTERRRNPRWPANRSVRAECRLGVRGLGADIGAVLFDVSADGVRLTVAAAVAERQEVEVLLVPPWGRDIRRVAEVVWSAPRDETTHWAGLKLKLPLGLGELRDLK